jgi:uncharacterized protein YukE
MAQSAPTDAPPFKVVQPSTPRSATAAQIAGIVGVVICVALVVLTWIALARFGSAVNDLGDGVNSAFNRATDATTNVAGKLDAAAVTAGTITTDANTAATAPTPDAISRLSNRVGQFADSYRGLRVQYGEIRENVTGAISSLQRVARFVPGLDVPSQPADALAAVDAKLQSIDDSITSAWQGLQSTASNAAATAVAAATTKIQSVLTETSTAVRSLNDRLVAAQAKSASAVDSLRTILIIVAIVITILLAWILILHVALWRLGRHWRTEARA